jgi:hypothetical protein
MIFLGRGWSIDTLSYKLSLVINTALISRSTDVHRNNIGKKENEHHRIKTLIQGIII